MVDSEQITDYSWSDNRSKWKEVFRNKLKTMIAVSKIIENCNIYKKDKIKTELPLIIATILKACVTKTQQAIVIKLYVWVAHYKTIGSQYLKLLTA